jgi:hypothetical protein
VRLVTLSAFVACAAALAAGCGSSSENAQTPASNPSPTGSGTAGLASSEVCASQQQQGITANFGFRRSTAAADKLVTHAEGFGFQNLTVQRRACTRYAVVLIGLMSMQQARDFRAEASRVGLHVRLECRSTPVRGGVAAVFGHSRTRRGAIVLMRRATALGFQNLQVQQDRCDDWEVDLYGVSTAKQRRTLRREARRAGYHLTFERG